MEHLSPREYVVARLVVMGNSDGEIARKLRLSVRTIENTLASVYSKLGVSTREQVAVAFPKARRPTLT
ncbi:MAG TPA: LuxR C-terminal-related transcriptional regulator [Candidatus Baltobacteraceae bacterium]|nr:LuxR C-terminal-related transcriptional regulator [Candidatus Baltobacteraceae bacterium]